MKLGEGGHATGFVPNEKGKYQKNKKVWTPRETAF